MHKRLTPALAFALVFAGVSASAARAEREVQVQPGETLTAVSLRYYGDALRAFEIAALNHLDVSTALQPGEVLLLPDLPSSGSWLRAGTDIGAELAVALSRNSAQAAIPHDQALGATSQATPSTAPSFSVPVLNTPASPDAAIQGVSAALPAPAPASGPAFQSGIATWYGPGFVGNRTYCGDVYDDTAMTAASNTLPCGAVVVVTDIDNGRSVQVRVNDRGAFQPPIIMDLSRGAFAQLAPNDQGVVRVTISVPAQ